MTNSSTSLKYLFILLLGVACLAAGGIFVKLSELGPIATAFYRILLAMPVAIIWARFNSAPRPRNGFWNVPRGDFGLLICAGAFLAYFFSSHHRRQREFVGKLSTFCSDTNIVVFI